MTRAKSQLPKQQLLILALCRFAEPIALTSVFPYLPEMIESFNVPTDKVAQWAGTTSAIFSLSQCLTGIWWGQASDQYGRKTTILLSLTCTMISSILFGFSKTLLWALLARALGGMASGNVGTIRTTVAELVPQRDLQPKAFALMPMVWQVGSILGPALGGALVHPNDHFPGLFHHSSFFRRHPFCLPGLVGGIFFLVGLLSGFLFLQETLEARKYRKDYGLMLGSELVASCSKRKGLHRRAKSWHAADHESRPLLAGDSGQEPGTPLPRTKPAKQRIPTKEPGYRHIFSRQSVINLCAYTLLSMHSVAYDQLLPVFMHHPRQQIDSPNVHLPFRFAGGFGISAGRIGALFAIYGIYGMLIQVTVFPPVARKIGVLNCFKMSALGFPVIYLLTPFTSLLPSQLMMQAVMLVLMLFKVGLCVFAFPCSTILLTNSAVSLKILGTLNGVTTSISALGRASGPALCGVAFTVGVKKGYVIASWWLLTIIAILAAVPVFWLVEMEGFATKTEGEGGDVAEETQGDANAPSPRFGSTLPTTALTASVVRESIFEAPGRGSEDAASLDQSVSPEMRAKPSRK